MKNNLLILCILWVASSCTPIAQSSGNFGSNPKVLQLIDQAYEPQIKTVMLHPDGAPLQPAVTRLGQWNLVLEFDDLRSENDTYYARIEHCNYNWTKSSLQDLDYMTVYNEFPINTYQYSIDTHVPYVHYTFAVPGVKLPGNYVLVVYRGSDKEDIILSRRFMVFDTRVTFTSDGALIGPGTLANLNQQLNFTVSYKSLDILNPMTDVHVNIRQNQRWDNIALDLKPSFVREIEKELEYRFFDESKMFRGGNEFRFFDLRSLNNPGRNVDYVTRTAKPFDAYIQKDKTRQGQSYAQYNDLNGNFTIDNYDFRDLLYTNYVNVHFTLVTPPVDGDVYVAGGFNYWALNKNNRMQYDSAKGAYTSGILLKQGWYDYQFLVKSSTLPSYYFEGSHFETENTYEVLVYYRPFQPQADLLIGYISLEKNAR